jgi:hypothetical protein
MTTVNKKGLRAESVAGGGTPYGNNGVNRYRLATNSSGVMADSDLATALQIADVVRLGVIPAGTYLDDCLSIVSDAFTASMTMKLGFAYVDGTDSTDVPQDDDYFHAALALDATGRTRANNAAVAPVKLPKPAYLIATIAGAAAAAAGVVDVLVFGESGGVA